MSWFGNTKKDKMIDKIARMDLKINDIEHQLDTAVAKIQGLKVRSALTLYDDERQLEDLRYTLRSFLFDVEEIEHELGIDQHTTSLRDRITHNFEKAHRVIVMILSR
jgi:hypothetical protein